MQFVQSFLLVASFLFILYIAQYSFVHRKTPGALAFFILTVAALIWTLGSFCELYATTLAGKILWRNIQQIGVFGVPISTVYFAVIYTRKTKFLKYVYAAGVPSFFAVILIFTNGLHHLMRVECSLEQTADFGTSLVVQSTIFGSILVSYNFVLPFFAIFILLGFSRKVSPDIRKQVYLIVFSFLLTFVVAWVKTAILDELGFYIHISVLYTPSVIIMFYCIFKHRTFRLSPIARDKVFEVVNQGILVMDEDSMIVDANAYALSCLKDYFELTEPIGLKLKEINTYYTALNEIIGSEAEEHIDINVKKKSEEAFISLKYYPLFQSKGAVVGAVLIINNITVQKLFERSLKEKAEKDYLTNVLNKFGFQKSVQKSINSNDSDFERYSVLMIDLDNFKRLNDTFGHAAGDMILQHFAEALTGVIRSKDIAGRIGGDEFAVVLPTVLKTAAFQIAERIRKAVQNSEVIIHDNQKIYYSVSIGIADNDTEEKQFDEILKKADKALYKAKNIKRNCSVIFKDQDT